MQTHPGDQAQRRDDVPRVTELVRDGTGLPHFKDQRGTVRLQLVNIDVKPCLTHPGARSGAGAQN